MWRNVCLRNPFSPFLLGTRSPHSPWERAAACSTVSTWLRHSQICCSWRRKPVSCREGEGLVTELWSPKMVSIYWLCSSVTTADKAFSLRGLEAGLWAFRLPMFATYDDMLFSESIPAIPFWNSKPPLPTRSLRFLRAAAPSSTSALWLHHAHPFVAAAGKTSLLQRSRGLGHGVVVSKICYNTVFVLSVVLCDCCKPMNHCWDGAFSNSELEVGLPALQLPMFPNSDSLPKRDLCDMFV